MLALFVLFQLLFLAFLLHLLGDGVQNWSLTQMDHFFVQNVTHMSIWWFSTRWHWSIFELRTELRSHIDNFELIFLSHSSRYQFPLKIIGIIFHFFQSLSFSNFVIFPLLIEIFTCLLKIFGVLDIWVFCITVVVVYLLFLFVWRTNIC